MYAVPIEGQSPDTSVRGFVAARPRALVAFAATAAGCVVARETGPLWALPCFILALIGSLWALGARDGIAKLLLVLSLLTFSIGYFNARVYVTSPSSLCALTEGQTPEQERILTLRGLVLDAPRKTDPPAGELSGFAIYATRWAFRLDADSLVESDGPHPTSGEVWCFVAGDASPAILPGDRVQITGIFDPGRPPLNPGQSPRHLYAAQRGGAGTLTTSDASLVTGADAPRSLQALHASWVRVHAGARGHASRVLARLTKKSSPGAQAMTRSLILGEASPELDDLRQTFTRLGLLHILSISGFHLSVLAWAGLFVVRIFGERGMVEPVLVAILVLAYLGVVPAEAPVMRSGVLVLVLLAAECSGRRYDALTITIWTSLGLLMWRPMDLWSPGYQLSCGLTALLMWLGARTHARIWGIALRVPGTRVAPSVRRVIWAYLRASFSASLLCWGVSVPLIWFHTGLISPFAVLAGLVVTPILVPLMVLGFLALLVCAIVPALASHLGFMLTFPAEGAAWAMRCLDHLPLASVAAPPIPWWSAVAAGGAVLYWFARGKAREAFPWVLSGLALSLVALGIASRTWLSRPTLLRLDTFAVGDGTCHVLRSGDECILWDCGSLSPAIGVRELPRALRARGIWRTRRAVLSHGDFDHVSAILDLAEPFGIREVIVGSRFFLRAKERPDGPLPLLFAKLRERGIDVKLASAGDVIHLAQVEIRFLSPKGSAEYQAENDHSFVARVDPAGSSLNQTALLLLSGDIQSGAISDLSGHAIRAAVVEAPHHGSARADAARFVGSLAPTVVIQSTGPRRLGAPMWDAARRDSTWLATPKTGAVWVEWTDRGLIRWGSERGERGEAPGAVR